MTTMTSILSGPAFSFPRINLPLAKWIQVARERRALADMSPHMLRDIGLDPMTSAAEVRRPFWDLPQGR